MRKFIIASLILGSAATGGDIATGAAIGGAVGAVGGSQIKKDNDRCWRYDRNGDRYWAC